SVVVSELLDTVERSFFVPPEHLGDGEKAAGAVRRRVVSHHPLQPFSPRNFAAGDDRLFGYSRADFHGARALVEARRGAAAASAPFLAAPLAVLAPERRQIDIDQLTRFFENPTRAFLQRRLAIYLGDDFVQVEDREPLDLNNLERWQVGNVLLRVCD